VPLPTFLWGGSGPGLGPRTGPSKGGAGGSRTLHGGRGGARLLHRPHSDQRRRSLGHLRWPPPAARRGPRQAVGGRTRTGPGPRRSVLPQVGRTGEADGQEPAALDQAPEYGAYTQAPSPALAPTGGGAGTIAAPPTKSLGGLPFAFFSKN